MDSRLANELDRVSQRIHRLSLMRWLSLCWLMAAAVGVLLIFFSPVTGLGSGSLLLLVIGLSALLAGTAVLFAGRRRCRQLATARRIERQFPELDNRLMAAIEAPEPHVFERTSYLQSLVIDEAVQHGASHRWNDVVSDHHWNAARLAHGLSLVAMVAVLGALAVLPAHWAEHGTGPYRWLASVANQFDVKVDPGDAAIERGTQLLVLARFSGPIPANVYVVYGETPDESRKLQLPKSLDDPVFGGRVTDVQSDLTYYVEFDGQQSDQFRVTVFDYPAIERVDAEISFPDYAADSASRVEDTRQVSVVEGSTVTIVCKLNKPVAQAWARVSGGDSEQSATGKKPDANSGEQLPFAFDDDPLECRLAIVARQTQRLTLHLVDADGRQNKLPPEFVINVLPNRPPELALTFPGRDTSASPIEELVLQATAWDDFGVRALGIEYAIGTEPSKNLVLAESIPAKEKRQIDHVLFLESLDAQPDQLLSYHFWADDIGPDGQVRRTRSDMFFAEVRPFEEIFRQGQQPSQGQSASGQQGGGAQQAEQLTELQKQIINATWRVIRQQSGKAPGDAFTQDVAVIRQSEETALEQVASLKEMAASPEIGESIADVEKHMRSAIEFLTTAAEDKSQESLERALVAEQAAYQSLLTLRSREHDVVRGQQSQSGSGSASRADRQLQELELDANENRYEEQRTASSQQQQASREDLQILNRLRELARRQEDLNERIKELQSALEAAIEEQKEELRRQLARLREDQQELLRDLDELRNRMEQPENQQRMADTQRQLEETRSNVRRAAESLEAGELSQSLTSGTRAQRELEQMRDEMRKRTANEFADEMRGMRQQARDLDEKEKSLAEEIDQLKDGAHQSLRDSRRQNVAEELSRQQERLQGLSEQMKSVSERAETAEPLLSRQLYDTLRNTHQRNIAQNMEMAAELLRRGFVSEADRAEARVAEDVEELRESVERAAEGVLGDPAEITRRALEEVRDLSRQLEREIAQADPSQAADRGDRETEPPNSATGSEQPGDRENQSAKAQRSNGEQGNREGQSAASERTRSEVEPAHQSAQAPSDSGSPSPGASPSNRENSRDAERGGEGRREPANSPGSRQAFDATGWTAPSGPITGGEFREWSDRLRNVEEMLDNEELRSEVATIRDRAGSMRAETKRHSKEPNWSLVRSLVAEPLVELETKLREELARLQPDGQLVPIDRDPVPRRYAEQVRRYYERLGSGQ